MRDKEIERGGKRKREREERERKRLMEGGKRKPEID